MLPPVLRRWILAFALVCAACTTPAEAACKGLDVRLVTPGRLTVAADYSYPPFAFRSAKGDLTGYEVDLVKAVAREMKLEASFVNRGGASLVPGLLSHRQDLAASGLRPSDELRDQACVSTSYLSADLGVLVAKDAAQDVDAVEDLAGRTVAVLDESEAEAWALAHLKQSTLASLPATDDLLTALRQGRTDAVVADLPFARFSQARSADFAVVARVESEDGYVFAAGPDNAALISGVDDALGRLQSKGTMAKLDRKWFGG